MRRAGLFLLFAVISLLAATPAPAFEPQKTFQEGSFIWSFEGGGGNQENLEGHTFQTDLDFWYVGARLGWLPFGPSGVSWYYGAFEIGLEGIYQKYTGPVDAYWGGAALLGKYHFLSLGRVVPYVELQAGVGATDLKVREIDSDFAFLLGGGLGLSVFLTDTMALYGGYRLVHISNGNADTPNRGFEAHTGVGGISFFFK